MRLNINIASYESDRIFEMFDQLSEIQRKVLALRFGIDGRKRTLSEVGKIVGMPHTEVRIIEARAIQTLTTLGMFDEYED